MIRNYMAALRNLRNIAEEGVEEEIVRKLTKELVNPIAVRNSKQFPYRFYTAYKMLEQTNTSHPRLQQIFQSALEDAMTRSLNNLPSWPGVTAVVADFSGSMDQHLSSNSVVSLKEVAALFMVMSSKMCHEAHNIIFANSIKTVNIHERSGILDNVQRILGNSVGTSTDAWRVIAHLIYNRIKVDRMVFFSDMQCYNSGDKDRVSRDEGEEGGWSYHYDQIAPLWNRYKRMINPNAYLYSFNLADYGTSIVPMSTHNLFLGSGFSDKILNFVPLFESHKNTLVDRVRNVESQMFWTKHPERKIKQLASKRGSHSEVDDTTNDTITAETVE